MANSQRLRTVRLAIEGYLASQADQPGCDLSLNAISNVDGDSTTELALDRVGPDVNQVPRVDCSISDESILIRDEHYCGRRFSTSTHRAVWFIEEDQVKIYTTDQQLCCVLNADEIDLAADGASSSPPHVISFNSTQVESADRDDTAGDQGFRRAA